MILNSHQLAAILGVTTETIRAWRKRRLIPFIQVNATTIRYDAMEVIAELKERSDRKVRDEA
jgi:DNA-binding transcriptional MerR regulator